jgi:hypothetical protein
VLFSYYWLALFLIENSGKRIFVSVETRIVYADPVKSVSQLEDMESLSLNIILQPIFYKFWPSLIAFFWRSCAKFDSLGCSKKTLVIRLVSASTMLHGRLLAEPLYAGIIVFTKKSQNLINFGSA